MIQRTALIGNAPGRTEQGDAIDACSHVVRINNCYGLGDGRGARTDDLFLVNCGGQMAEWLETEEILKAPGFVAARRIVLPFAADPAASRRDSLDAANFAEQAQEKFEDHGKEVAIVPLATSRRARKLVGGAAPSTGLIALLWLLEEYPARPVEAFGFGFAGWDGHDFEKERQLFGRQAREGQLSLWPPH
ncbi:MAG: hypothetical protein V2I43_12170 [Parvularcula sp.]|jgi:hypothetical protein|nr:hypothetical protein [Parvularcula sp.]